MTIRLWHYELIPVLPNKMLVSEWRELIAIKRQWEKGILKHRLVSYVMDYDKGYFWEYFSEILQELINRDIKYKDVYITEIDNFCNPRINNKYSRYKEHNDRYLKQCLYNLEEKATRNIISKEEWLRIYNKFKDFTDLWKGGKII